MRCVLCGGNRFSDIHKVKKCNNCGLVQVSPMPSEMGIRALYHEDLAHFDPYIAQKAVHREYFRKKIKEIKKQGSLLDIGCATGILLEEAKRVGIKAQGVDISADAVALCRKKGLRVSRIWPKTTFDVITAFEILEHERDPLGMMRRIQKMLKNGGVAVLTTPDHSSIWRKIMGRWWVGYKHPEHVTFWDPVSLRKLFERAGFKNISIKHDSPRPFPLSFAFSRAADYFPWLGFLLRPVGIFVDRFHLKNPINPWSDLIGIGKKA